jgi:glycosyltransferase involved in cell wall biosynthesis
MNVSVSVIIPTLGRPDTLRRAVVSATEQTHAPAEVIVVDDNDQHPDARDETHAIAERIDAPIRVLEHTGTSGGSAARNFGAQHASGELLAFLDDDDWWLSTKLERQIETLHDTQRNDIGLIYTGLRVVDEDGALLRERYKATKPNMVHALAEQNLIGTVSSVLIPKRVFESIGGFDPELPARQDLDLWLRIARHWSIAAVREPLTVYVNHEHGISKDFEKKLRAHQLFLEKHRDLYDAHPQLLSAYHYATALLCLKHNRVALARSYLLKSLSARISLRALARLSAALLRRGTAP